MDLNSFFPSLYASEIGLTVVLTRLLFAAIMGGILGFDREMLSRPAGMRTHMLVSLAAATFTVVTFELIEQAKAEGSTSVDPIRIIEAVTAGVAFLAAGAIIQSRGKIHGVTTGAGLWLAGAVGTAWMDLRFVILLVAARLVFALVVTGRDPRPTHAFLYRRRQIHRLGEELHPRTVLDPARWEPVDRPGTLGTDLAARAAEWLFKQLQAAGGEAWLVGRSSDERVGVRLPDGRSGISAQLVVIPVRLR